MATVNGARLIEDLQTLREFGSHPPGVVRAQLSARPIWPRAIGWPTASPPPA